MGNPTHLGNVAKPAIRVAQSLANPSTIASGAVFTAPHFPSRRIPFSSLRAWQVVREKAELEDVRMHDFRYPVASDAMMSGESLPTVGKILGHTQAQITARYAHLADAPLRSASDRVASSLKKAMDGWK